MLDLHTHLLPGVDDGSPSVEVSVPVLARFAEQGVRVVVCTPHLNASNARRAPYERHLEILEGLRAAAPKATKLELGWEIMLDEPGVDLTDKRLALAGSSAVLVEFPRMGIPLNATAELFRLRMSGIVPVLAHPERYPGCTPEKVEEWRRAGAVMQLDAIALGGRGSRAKLGMELLALGLIDLVASDTHGDARSLGPARGWLERAGGEDYATLLTETNPRRLLESEPIEAVRPLPRDRGMFDRLRSLFGAAS